MITEKHVLVIAEVGVNHNGDMALAKKIVDSIAHIDVDIIKFQTLIPDLLMVPSTPKAEYQKESTGTSESAFEMISKLQFSFEEFIELRDYVEAAGKKFLSTAFDLKSLAFLHDLGIRHFKIPSGEITNLPYLRETARLADDIILSTGMSTMKDIAQALDALLAEGFEKSKITVLQCNTAYPTPLEDCNLRAMNTMSTQLNVKIGFSDHTEGISAPLAAVALGATVIEKHVTIDKNLPGPDQHASMEPDQLEILVRNIREIELALGSDRKTVSESEKLNIPIARRGLYAAQDIEPGTVITSENLVALRPEADISPMEIDLIVGKSSQQYIPKYAPINWSQFTN